MARTQDEIMRRFLEVDDFFGTQKTDLIELMEWKEAKPFYREEYVKDVEEGKVIHTPCTDTKARILDYLPFAYGKARHERGLSAARSLYHMRTWIWFDDREFSKVIEPLIDDYTEYGIPILDKIAAHYGYVETEKV